VNVKTDLASWGPLLASLPLLLVFSAAFVKFAVVLALLGRALGGPLPVLQVVTPVSLLLAFSVTAPLLRGSPGSDMMEPTQAYLERHTSAAERQNFFDLAKSGAAGKQSVNSRDLAVLVPAFVASELKLAFQLGFLLLLPFLVLDLIVSGTLHSIGMTSLDPRAVALPIKLLLFVVADGWHLLLSTLLGQTA
jgi:flagellar biosynthesis protein FliP